MAYVTKVIVRYRNDDTGREVQLPGLLTQAGILISHLRYLASKRIKSESWKERSTFAVRLLIKYINANENCFEETRDLLSAFAQAIEFGTIDHETLVDPSGLYWNPRRSEDSRTLLYHLTHYTDWLAERPEYNTKRANPFRKANSEEEKMNWCAYYNKEAHVFLSHLSDPNEASRRNNKVRTIQASKPPKSSGRFTKRFPEDEIDNLLMNGWVRRSEIQDPTEHAYIDYKGRAITLLMHYGGVRKSEVFQLYLQDIIVDRKRGEAVVRIYHPALGESPDKRYKSRREFLACRYQLKPRTDYPKSKALHAGWKAPLLTDATGKYFQINFAPVAIAKEFLLTFECYLRHQRVDAPVDSAHPYAFTNSKGEPETLKNFSRQHKNAVGRIGLQHDKHLGTSEHGHRHAYGFRLHEYGFSQIEIQKAMHHKHPESCLVYIQKTDEEIRACFEKVEREASVRHGLSQR
ncbi:MULTISPECIES: gamma-mobile-trio recombinase GmtY [unclassified Pseudomonas]|uniref:gamma-mobile-trio recombinase GmtY n=1 Tax=unclassified Pseudomonas TaxID=196821 RepID=UPI0005384C6C|nr:MULTISPECIES: gamma-mobile-trio recombinase GmtY [unclassified Pseudomonas]MBD0683533.1 integrase [Pseudomonas sp. PSB18]CDF93883.1 phage integrase family protein [Pseudomonas sp. SHC52]